MKHFLRRLTRPLLALAILATPTAAIAAPTAQEGALDEATLAAIQQAAVAVYSGFGGPGASVAIVAPSEDPTPEATPDPSGNAGVPEVGEMVTYTSDELEIAFPANWEVIQSGTNFNVSDEASYLLLQFENFGEDVPGLLMVPIFEGQSDLFERQLGDGASIDDIRRLTIGADELPALRMEFSGVPDSKAGTMDGVIYIMAAGRDGYALYAGAGAEAWETLGPVVDEIVGNLQIHPEYITLQRSADELVRVASVDGAYSIELPTGWMGSITDDDDLGIIFADPELTIVGAAGASPEAEAGDPMLISLIESLSGDLDDVMMEEIAQNVIDNMNLGGNDGVEFDNSLSAVLPAGSEDVIGIIRMVGSAPIMDDAAMPIAMYLSVYADRAGAFVFFGEAEEILALESEILGIIDTLQFE